MLISPKNNVSFINELSKSGKWALKLAQLSLTRILKESEEKQEISAIVTFMRRLRRKMRGACVPRPIKKRPRRAAQLQTALLTA
jgi:hypothetical protein